MPIAQAAPTSENFHKRNYRPDIDGLRAIAVISVVIFHAFPSSLKGGFVGVDIFFVISGFIITSIIFFDLSSERFSLLDFYARRARRIFPALILILAFCMAIGYFALFSDEYAELGKHVLFSSLFVQNFNLLTEIGYFDRESALKPLLHIWSLSIEEQFYLVWPCLLLLVATQNNRLLVLALFFLVLSFFANIYFTANNPNFAFYLPITRFWELMLGAVGAYALKVRLWNEKLSHALSAMGAVLLLLGFVVIRKSDGFPGWQALIPTIGALLIIIGSPKSIVNQSLASKPLVWIGLISYPLYLWHWPLLSFARIGFSDGTLREPPASWRFAAVLLSVVLAWLTFRYVEQPIRHSKKSGSLLMGPGARALAVIAVLAVTAHVGFSIYAASGLPNRVDLQPPSARELFEPYPHPLANNTCRTRIPELASAWSCLLSKDSDPELLIVGDSHAHQYYNSFSSFFPSHSVLNFSAPSCLPFSSNVSERCKEQIRLLRQILEKYPTIKIVVLTGYFSFLEGGFKYKNVEGMRVASDAPTPDDSAAFRAAATSMIRSLLAEGKKVVVLRDIPDLVFNPRSCVTYGNIIMALLRGMGTNRTGSNCGIPLEEFEARNKIYDLSLSSILAEFPEVLEVNPRSLFCRGGFCRAIDGDVFLYWNSDHLTIHGANMVVSKFSDIIVKFSK